MQQRMHYGSNADSWACSACSLCTLAKRKYTECATVKRLAKKVSLPLHPIRGLSRTRRSKAHAWLQAISVGLSWRGCRCTAVSQQAHTHEVTCCTVAQSTSRHGSRTHMLICFMLGLAHACSYASCCMVARSTVVILPQFAQHTCTDAIQTSPMSVLLLIESTTGALPRPKHACGNTGTNTQGSISAM